MYVFLASFIYSFIYLFINKRSVVNHYYYRNYPCTYIGAAYYTQELNINFLSG